MPLKPIKLHTAVLLPFVIILLLTISIVGIVQKQSYESMLKEVSQNQLSALTHNVTQHLQHFLGAPRIVNRFIGQGISSHQLYQPHDMSAIQEYILANFSELYLYMPQLDVISFSSVNGDFVGFRKEENQTLSLMLKDQRTQDQLIIYFSPYINPTIRSVIDGYDPRTRPFYVPVAYERLPAWSDLYVNSDEVSAITLSRVAPIYDKDQFIGVLAVDTTVNTLNTLLTRLKKTTQANIVIFDREQQLVAHSELSNVYDQKATDNNNHRLTITQSKNAILNALSQTFDSLQTRIDNPIIFNTWINGERYFNQLSVFSDPLNLTWYINVSLSEKELLGTLFIKQRESWLLGGLVSLLGITFGLIAFNRITASITKVTKAAEQLAQGDWNIAMPKKGRIYETNRLIQAFEKMAHNLKRSFKSLREQLIYDSLTKLYSRQGIIDLENQFDELTGCLILIGVDKFRDVNDSFGYHQADQLLVYIAQRLKTLTTKENYIARIGGDEFAVYLPQHTDYQEVKKLISQVVQLFSTPFMLSNESVAVNVSIGVAYNLDSNSMVAWLRNSSIALSNAKQDPSRISCYSPEMSDTSRQRTRLVTRIKLAIENHEFIPYYQPIVDLHSEQVIGGEALARWISPEHGLIPPMEFIPIAEESGLIHEIGAAILYQACADTVRGITEGKWSDRFRMHVNLSVNQISNPEFINQLKSILKETQIQTKNLTLEITESRLVDNDPVLMNTIHAIKALGIHLAIDDFGTGYSSLAYLYKLPFNCLKIDRAFVLQLTPEHYESSIAALIISLAKSFKANIVAEGIEDEQQAQLLKQLGCPQAQGFLFSRPMPYHDW